MKKWILFITLILHLCISVFFSFDWSFLEGEYLGFGLTFLIIYCFSIPVVISGLAIGSAVYQLVKKTLSVTDVISGVLGICVIATYVLSTSGALKNTDITGIAYAVLPFGTVTIIACQIGKIIYKRITKRRRYRE